MKSPLFSALPEPLLSASQLLHALPLLQASLALTIIVFIPFRVGPFFIPRIRREVVDVVFRLLPGWIILKKRKKEKRTRSINKIRKRGGAAGHQHADGEGAV